MVSIGPVPMSLALPLASVFVMSATDLWTTNEG